MNVSALIYDRGFFLPLNVKFETSIRKIERPIF